MSKRIAILGANFAGLTAAIDLKKRVKGRHVVTVLSQADEFVFAPSLIWVPFGQQDNKRITFPIAPILQQRGIRFQKTEGNRIDLQAREVVTAEGTEPYDYLVIATGRKTNYGAIPGLGPYEGYTQSIFTLDDALKARQAFEALLEKPGPVVIGAAGGAAGFATALEFLINMAAHLKKRGIQEEAPITYLSPEPFLGHFGMGGQGSGAKLLPEYFGKVGIKAELNASIQEVTPDEIILEDGRRIPFAFAVISPPSLGVDAVRNCASLVDDDGFVEVDDRYQTERYPEVYAAGEAMALDPLDETPVPCGAPKMGYVAEESARVVAHNIVAALQGEKPIRLPPESILARGLLEAGGAGAAITTEHLLQPREQAWLIPGPDSYWAKQAYDKYFLSGRRRGRA